MASAKELLDTIDAKLAELKALVKKLASTQEERAFAIGSSAEAEADRGSNDGVLVGRFAADAGLRGFFGPMVPFEPDSRSSEEPREEEEESDGIKGDSEPESESNCEPSEDESFSSAGSLSDEEEEQSSEEEEEPPVKQRRKSSASRHQNAPAEPKSPLKRRRSTRARTAASRYVPVIDAKGDRFADAHGEDIGAPSKLWASERRTIREAFEALDERGWKAFLAEPWTKTHLADPLQIILNAWGNNPKKLTKLIMGALMDGTSASVCERVSAGQRKRHCNLCDTAKPCVYHIEGLGHVGKVCGDLFMAIMDLGQLCTQLAADATEPNEAWRQFHEGMTAVQTIHASKGGGTRRPYKRIRAARPKGSRLDSDDE
jgi:hypothetical protein